jgi:hypothetical protein
MVVVAILFSGCKKQAALVLSPPPPPPIGDLIANAGSDTSICMPFGGTGNSFKGTLDGSASHDKSGNIISYYWAEISGSNPSVVFSTEMKPEILLSGGLHRIVLTVQNNHNQWAEDTVLIDVIQKFIMEYDGLSWDSTVGGLMTISVKLKPALIQSWPGPFDSKQSNSVFISNYDGTCKDIGSWNQLPYVPYDSIQLTDKSIFYSVIVSPPNTVNFGTSYPEIFAKTNSGIDFTQRVSLGFTDGNPSGAGSGAGDWDY